MGNGGTGIGSASIVLIFAVLCLTIFSLISLSSARADKEIASAGAELVKAYYEADTLAERILDEIISADVIPDSVLGVAISEGYDEGIGAQTAGFSCPISDAKELYVEIALYGDSYELRKWRMQDVGQWALDEEMMVWPGFDEEESLALWPGNEEEGSLPVWSGNP